MVQLAVHCAIDRAAHRRTNLLRVRRTIDDDVDCAALHRCRAVRVVRDRRWRRDDVGSGCASASACDTKCSPYVGGNLAQARDATQGLDEATGKRHRRLDRVHERLAHHIAKGRQQARVGKLHDEIAYRYEAAEDEPQRLNDCVKTEAEDVAEGCTLGRASRQEVVHQLAEKLQHLAKARGRFWSDNLPKQRVFTTCQRKDVIEREPEQQAGCNGCKHRRNRSPSCRGRGDPRCGIDVHRGCDGGKTHDRGDAEDLRGVASLTEPPSHAGNLLLHPFDRGHQPRNEVSRESARRVLDAHEGVVGVLQRIDGRAIHLHTECSVLGRQVCDSRATLLQQGQ